MLKLHDDDDDDDDDDVGDGLRLNVFFFKDNIVECICSWDGKSLRHPDALYAHGMASPSGIRMPFVLRGSRSSRHSYKEVVQQLIVVLGEGGPQKRPIV